MSDRNLSTASDAHTLKVPGATLYYRVDGSGPVLLMIPGGPADADAFAGMTPLLADSYSVLAYDPRGISRSRFDGLPEDVSIELNADDAARLLAATTTAPAYVFGSSGGAQIGLSLVARHPRQVHTLVAHEPPAAALLPDSESRRAFMQEVYETYMKSGAGAAMQKFMAGAGFEAPPPPTQVPPEALEATAQMQRNVEFWFAHTFLAIGTYAPDIAALKAAESRVVVGVGEASAGQLAHQTGLALAERLGTRAVIFPGDHGGFGRAPEAFAGKLREVLREG